MKLSLFGPVVFCFFVRGQTLWDPVIIPAGAEMTRINETTSRWIGSMCGRSTEHKFNLDDLRVTGRKYPWAVSIMLHGRNKVGGTVISPHHVLTAAHGFVRFKTFEQKPCVIKRYRTAVELGQRVVAVGGDCIRGRTRVLPNHPKCSHTTSIYNRIKAVYVDSEFVSKGCAGGHDWAVVELRDPLPFNDHIQPICLPSLTQHLRDVFTVVSWGKRNVFEEASPLMSEMQMRHDPKCRPPWSDKMPTDLPDYICAKALNPYDMDSLRTCHGDSGAGLEQRDYYGVSTLVGITSFGSRGCPVNELARFTRVNSYLEQICEVTGVCYPLEK